MIVRWTDDGWKREGLLLEALRLAMDGTHVVSVVGAGGKTSVIRRLQRECLQEKIRHVVTTTTHMQYEESESFLAVSGKALDGEAGWISDGLVKRVMETADRLGTVWLGEPVSEKKMKGVPAGVLKQLYDGGLWLLIEADGAKRLPVKAPREDEPVILPFSTDVVCVYGLDALGCPIGEVCCRVDRVTDILGKTSRDLLTAVDIARLAASDAGGRKLVSKDMRYVVILNKADTEKRLKLAAEIAGMLKRQGVDTVLATSALMPRTGV